MALDLSKQVGPLPLGAWVAVVAGGLGIAYYSYTRSQSSASDTTTDDTSGQAGVGDGTVGGWTTTSPDTSTDTTNAAGTATPTTNEDWGYDAKQFLLGKGYPATTVESAIDKYINGITPSVQEYTLVGIAIAAIGPLPQSLPTGPAAPGGDDGTTPPATTTDSAMPYPTNQRITKLTATAVTMTWETTGRPSLMYSYRDGNPGTPMLPNTHSYTFARLKPNTSYRLGIAYQYGTRVGPRHDITVKTPAK